MMSARVDELRARTSRKKKVSKEEQSHEDWLSRRLSAYNYSRDARLEAMMNYPQRNLLYRKHVDIDKRYERTTKFYKICQNSCHNERNRQIRDTEEKFTKLLQHTFQSTPTKTQSLVSSYNKWMSRSLDQDEFDKIFDTNMRALESSNEFSKLIRQSTFTTGQASRMSFMRREPSHRSHSANITAKQVDVKSPFKNSKPTDRLHIASTSMH